MKAKFVRNYKKVAKNGQLVTVFVYAVSGTPEQLQAFKKAQGDAHRESDAGESLFFSTRFYGNNVGLNISAKGGVFADTSAMDQVSSLVAQYPGALGQEIAKLGAAKLLAGLTGASTPVSVPAASERIEA